MHIPFDDDPLIGLFHRTERDLGRRSIQFQVSQTPVAQFGVSMGHRAGRPFHAGIQRRQHLTFFDDISAVTVMLSNIPATGEVIVIV